MADEGFKGAGPGEPLAAPIEERLRARTELEHQAGTAREQDEHAHERVARRKAEERRSVAEHLAPYGAETPEGWRAQREAARSGPPSLARRGGAARGGAAFPLTPVWAALVVLVLPRALRWVIGLPVVLAMLFRNPSTR